MAEFISVQENGYSDSTSPISEPPDITNWFPSYVYESLPLSSSINESENEVDVVNKVNLGGVIDESLPSEPPDLANWFSSYVYESPVLDTSDVLELYVPGESECVKETQIENETPKIERNHVCPRLFEQELVSSTKVTDFSQSESVLSEPPNLRNWFSSYEYQSPQLSEIQELGFSSFEKDELVIEESDTEDGISSGIFRKLKSKQESTIGLGRLDSNDYKENIAADTAKEVSLDNAYSNQEMEKRSSVGLFNASKKEAKQESSFKQEALLCEPQEEARFSPRVSRYNPKPKSPSKNDASLHELRPIHIQESISMNTNRQMSPIDQESDDKENVNGQSSETGFVTMKKARFREARDQCSLKKPNRVVLMKCSSSKELKNIAGEEDKEERNKKRKILEEMSNHQSSGAEEMAGKWRCPQKNKRNIVPPLKQLRLDAWIHKV
ncbi:uncharacterized protein LOC9306203 isoform X1 [Arabidopsis lyrata subsp. lyrata]|uniref:uncharacterized protein LOC9306203 isoform X1 n=1 Tax=Arabidopsis lyrata subsp. lyrata TaxID=81972 RepID=UPI000A29C404|nr:uncharacterized protein LOC9306203 isoform X1 [Arabidopsis lyrata subsp. lyrata]|eukprot:XP_020875275.1 uncharacterized protein LOC9306203 isoform X1 [Arabidopsis lyrata subsp. lyrata]